MYNYFTHTLNNMLRSQLSKGVESNNMSVVFLTRLYKQVLKYYFLVCKLSIFNSETLAKCTFLKNPHLILEMYF